MRQDHNKGLKSSDQSIRFSTHTCTLVVIWANYMYYLEHKRKQVKLSCKKDGDENAMSNNINLW
jgi:hypothetical protein